MKNERYILASASPRRKEICELLGLDFEIIPAENEQPPAPGMSVKQTVLAIARGKAEEVANSHPGRTVIGADTVVAVDDCLLGKPHSTEEAVSMLMSLQGRHHDVVTAVWVCRSEDGTAKPCGDGFAESTQVWFYPMTEEECRAYVSTGEPMDKAGAYAVQGKGMRYIRKLNGDFYTVMGLPGAQLLRFLEKDFQKNS